MKACRDIDDNFWLQWLDTSDDFDNVPINDAFPAYCMGDEL